MSEATTAGFFAVVICCLGAGFDGANKSSSSASLYGEAVRAREALGVVFVVVLETVADRDE